MKKKGYFALSIALTVAILAGASNTSIISYACEKDEYLVVTENKDVDVKNISKLQADTIEKKDDVMCVEPMSCVSASGNIDLRSNTINYKDEWNLKMINAQNVNSYNKNKIKVAVLDSGIDYTDSINVVKRKNFVDKYEDLEVIYEDITGHGTSIASIMGAKYSDNTCVKGVNSNIEIYSAKILDENNMASMDKVIEAIYWAIDENVNIISISFGTNTDSKALQLAIKEAYNKGILVVAAAGNKHADIIEYPAAYDEVLAVGGVNSKGQISSYSSISNKIDIYAPGEQVKTLGAFDGEAVVSGTSIAVPHVVGVASLLWQKDTAKTNDFIKQLMIASANYNSVGKNIGVVDLDSALKMFDTFKCESNVTLKQKNALPINTSVLYTNSAIDYVTGSWCGNEHQETVTIASKKKLNFADVALLKWGAVYSDKSENLKGMTTNPYFHGYNKKKDYKTTKQDYNYLAGYIYLTRCALAGEINQDKTDLLNTTGNILEMDEKLSLIKFDGKEQFGDEWIKRSVLLGRANTNRNRSLLLLGMAMHAAADVYAHSSYTNVDGNWIYISHDSTDIKEADNKDFEPKRYASAKKIVQNVLNNYLQGKEGSVYDFVLPEEYYDGSYKIRNMYDYASEITELDEESAIILQGITR
ncbi:MAG: hypothetical protein E7262_06630 [Lachnospiraceae bacterium]|nr:hypothetical protein [Lachnospiraceae bacterium]